MRIALGVEYDGSCFYGWQVQPNLRTVQGEVIRAIEHVASHEIKLHAAGRTDTGVHAINQVVHFDTESERSSRAWIYGTNSQLPKDVCIRWAKIVPNEFHARFSAKTRRYRYVIYNHPIRTAIFTSHLTWQYRPLDHERMAEAANFLLGEHDFTSFRAVGCQAKTPVRTIHKFEVIRQNDFVILDITANAFLHHMIRNIAGVLMAIGTEKKDTDWIKEVLAAKDRTLGGETAPPYGLYLADVGYDDTFGLPVVSRGPLFI